MALSKLSGVVGILRETIQVLAKSGNAMTITATISIFFNFIHLFAILFVKPDYLLGKGTFMPQVPEAKHDAGFPWAIQLTMFFVSILVSFLVTVAIILVISTSYEGKSISSVGELFYRLVTSCFKPFITLLCIDMYIIGIFFMLSLLVILAVIFMFSRLDDIAAVNAIVISVGIVACLLLVYLWVAWFMGLVVSVVQENCYGFEALRKASRLVDGKRLDGFLLNFITFIGSVSIFQSTKMFASAESVAAKIVLGFLVSVLSCVTQLFMYSTYTVFYFQCLRTHGEEGELKGSLEYSKVPSSYIPLVSIDIP